MTAPADLSYPAGSPAGRRHRRRLRRALAAAGVAIPDARLAQISAGAAATPGEVLDIRFAETALRLRRDRRRCTALRARRRCTRAAIVAGAALLALAVVLCLGLGFFTLAVQMPG